MPKPIINGTLAPIRKPLKVSYDPSRGLLVTAEWQSAGLGLAGLAGAYQNLRIGYEWTPNARKSTLIATATGGQAGIPDLTVDTWQIVANEIQKDVKEHPAFAALDTTNMGYVLRDVNLVNQGQPVGNPAPTPATPASQLFWLLMRGTTQYALSQYVLRHTTNVSNVYAGNIADNNIEKVYTTDQLITETTNPQLWVFPMPGRLVAKLRAIVSPGAVPQYTWGWRKLASTEMSTASNRVEISTEYWLENWSTVLYPPAS